MAIEERELGVGEDTENEPDAAAEAAKRAEESEKRAQAEAVARARAEGELEALKRTHNNLPAPVAQGPTEAQWAEMENATGKTRAQIQADAQLMNSMLEARTAPLREELAVARKEAKEAKERAEKSDGKHSLSRTEEKFYKDNPAFTARRADIDAFVNKFPEELRSDPKKYAELLEDAKVYARGKARENISERRGGTQSRDSGRTEREVDTNLEEGDTERRETRLDLTGLEKGARRLVEDLHESFGKLDDRDEEDSKAVMADLKKYQTEDNMGVAIDSSEEFNRGARLLRGSDALGGARGKR